jgi:hypothetical protein
LEIIFKTNNMGYTSYDSQLRSSRAMNAGYHTKSVDDIFLQNKLSKIHESMDPLNLKNRECFDSANHPNTIALIFGLDVTGSMGHIPHMLIKDGLPTIMGTIVEKGSPDVALCFTAVGDHRSDKAPFQVGQFESGDAELDQWLERTWLESNGGGNGGESYALPWYFAAHHTDIDCMKKRNQKGILFTFGDENIHMDYDAQSIKNLFGNTAKVEGNVTATELLAEAKKKYHVYHISIDPKHSMSRWKELLGDNLKEISDHTKIPGLVADIVLKHSKEYSKAPTLVTHVDTPVNEARPSTSGTPQDTDVVFIK